MAVPDMWRTQKQRYSLQAEVCPHCTSAVFPPRKVCPYCKQAMVVTEKGSGSQGREFVYLMPVQAPAALVAVAGDD